MAVASGTLLLILDRRAGHGSNQEVTRDIERFSPNALTTVLIGVGGLTLLVKAGGGLYWLIPAAVASLAGGVVNAWLFLVGLTGESWTSELAMPPDQHVNPAEEPSSTSSPGRPADPAAEGTTFMKEGDIIAIGHATFRLVGGELIEYVDDGRSPR